MTASRVPKNQCQALHHRFRKERRKNLQRLQMGSCRDVRSWEIICKHGEQAMLPSWLDQLCPRSPQCTNSQLNRRSEPSKIVQVTASNIIQVVRCIQFCRRPRQSRRERRGPRPPIRQQARPSPHSERKSDIWPYALSLGMRTIAHEDFAEHVIECRASQGRSPNGFQKLECSADSSVKKLIADLLDTMRHAKGIGLAAQRTSRKKNREA